MAIIAGTILGGGVSTALGVGSGIWSYADRRKSHPNEPLPITLGYVGAWTVAPTAMMAISMAGLAGTMGQAAYMKGRQGEYDFSRRHQTGAIGGGFRDTERASMLREQTLSRGMSSRQLLAGQMGNEARRTYRGSQQ